MTSGTRYVEGEVERVSDDPWRCGWCEAAYVVPSLAAQCEERCYRLARTPRLTA